MWTPLSETLLDLVDSMMAPPGTGITVSEAFLEIPLEVQSALQNGKLVFFGAPPHSRWKSGVLPEVHMSRIRIELIGEV
jgi:hypothetical protein